MDKKQKAVEELKRQMRARKAEIDPKVLAVAQRAVKAAAGDGKTVPYDRAAAAKAVELFITNHPEQERFRDALLDFIGKNSH